MVRHAAAVAVVLVLSASPLHAQDANFTVTVASANVHAGPSTASAVIGRAAWGRTFEVTRELGSWVRVSWPAAPSGGGYLHVSWGTLERKVAGADGATAAPVGVVRTNAAVVEPAPRSVREPASSSPSASSQIDVQRPTAPGTPGAAVAIPSHVVGLGARFGTDAIGFAGSGRLWARDPFGLQFEVGRVTQASNAAFAPRLHMTTIGAGVIYSLPDLVADAVWIRPYLGGGASFYRSTLSTATGVSVPAENGLGYQALGGAEFTWAGLPHLSLSTDIRQEWAPTPFTGFETGGLGVALSAHWYVK